MSDIKTGSEFPVGRSLMLIREGAGLTQAQLAGKLSGKLKFSMASISRIESGDKDITHEELAAILKALGSVQAKQFGEFLKQKWDELDRPTFDHPDRINLWEANLALQKLQKLREDPELKSVFVRQIDLYEKELRRLAHYLRSREHRIAFIGSIGVGKSTGICKLTGLLKEGEDRLERQIVLETGGGGITLCEVHISHGPKYGLLIVPRSEESIRKDVEDFSEYLIKTIRPNPATAKLVVDEEEGDLLGISKEVVRAIRNMSGLTEKRKEEGGKKIRIDPAKELAEQFPKAQELTIQILTRMDLLRRNRRDMWYPDDSTQTPTQWLQKLFAAVNNGRHPEFTLPQKIEVVVPDPVFASHDLPIKIIDTKGIDQTAERQDLECHFDDARTLVVLCSKFNDAPELAVQTLLQRAKEAGVKDIEPKTVVLVLPRPEEAMAVKHDDGTKVEDDQEGYDLKRDQIEMPLKQKGLNALSVEFFNAKDELPETVRDRLVGKIIQYRAEYSKQISRVAEAVERLIANRAESDILLVFEDISRRLNTWINKHRQIDLPDLELHESLVAAIGNTRYASTIRAAVRRHGEWCNLDYFHQLAVGTRRTAVTQIGEKIRDFRAIVNNLIDDAELAPGQEFLLRVLESLDAAVDDALQRLHFIGREAFRDELEKDLEFWSGCERRWGAGPGYRSDISEMTDQQFAKYDDAYELVKGQISGEWNDIISLLEGMLGEVENSKSDLAIKL